MNIRVYYEDTDLGGVVYHSNYLNFCERARSELFFKAGKSPKLAQGHFVVKTIHANFIAPAKFGDILHVSTENLGLKGASFKLKQQIRREEMLLFEMEVTLAFIDHEGKLTRMAPEVRALLESLI